MGQKQVDWVQEIRFQEKYKTKNPISRMLTGRFLARITELASRVPEGSSVLDAGCGEGITLRSLSALNRGWRLSGIDMDEPSLDVARRVAPAAAIQKASIYELPFGDASFDLVLCTEVMEHLEHPEEALQSIRRVAARHVILSVPREPLWSMLNMARGKYLGSFGNTPGHIQRWSKAAYSRLIERYFDVLEISGPRPWTVLWARKR